MRCEFHVNTLFPKIKTKSPVLAPQQGTSIGQGKTEGRDSRERPHSRGCVLHNHGTRHGEGVRMQGCWGLGVGENHLPGLEHALCSPPTGSPLSAPSGSEGPAADSSRKPALPSPASALHRPLSGLHVPLCGSPMQCHAQCVLSPSGPLWLGLHLDSLPARYGPVTTPRALDSSPGQ